MRPTTHGHKTATYESPTYRSWKKMKSRCYNPNHRAYAWYGARGVEVEARWHEFASFLVDMGERPDGLWLGRIDNDKPYGPSNCCWSTPRERLKNRRSCRKNEYRGRVRTYRELSELSSQGISGRTIRDRIARYGWSVEDAVQKSLRG